MPNHKSFAILTQHVCCEDLCDFATAGWVLDPEGSPGPCGPYCERCGPKIVAEYCEKVSPGWTFRPGEIHGNLNERPPSPPAYLSTTPNRDELPEEEDCSFLDHVENILTRDPSKL